MKSVAKDMEEAILGAVRGLGCGVPCVGFLEAAAGGEPKEEDLSSLQVRVHGAAQRLEGRGMFTANAEIRLNVERSAAADGGLFASAHEAVALWLRGVSLGDGCAALSTDGAFVDGLQVVGGDSGFDTSTDGWYAVWNMTLSGRIKET